MNQPSDEPVFEKRRREIADQWDSGKIRGHELVDKFFIENKYSTYSVASLKSPRLRMLDVRYPTPNLLQGILGNLRGGLSTCSDDSTIGVHFFARVFSEAAH